MESVGHAFVAAAKCPACEVKDEWLDELRLENRRLQDLLMEPQFVKPSEDESQFEFPVRISTTKVSRRQMLRQMSKMSARAAKQDRASASVIESEIEL